MNIAVITGVSSGIGEKTAEELLAKGWSVYGLSRSKPASNDPKFKWLECDLANPDSIAESLQKITEEKIDLLISNAGIAFEEPASAATLESYKQMFNVNVLAPMLLVNNLRDKVKSGTIISVSSVSDRLVEKNFALYCSSKAANTRYFESLADELDQAKVITLLPDYVDTPMLRELQKGRDFDWKGTIKTKDVARLILDLADGRIDVQTGSNIIVVTESLIEDLDNQEKLYGFNTDSWELTKL